MKSGNKRIFLDTNTYSSLFRGDKHIAKKLNEAHEVLISVVTIGELYFGFKKGKSEDKNLLVLKEFLNNPKVKVVKISVVTAGHYGRIKYTLERMGTPIPSNDLWIAAGAIETDSALLTLDKHFREIDDIKKFILK